MRWPSLAVVVARNAHQPLAGECFGRRHRHLVDVLGKFVAVVNAAERDGALRGLRQRHAWRRRLCGKRARGRLRSLPGVPPWSFAAISWSFCLASIAAA